MNPSRSVSASPPQQPHPVRAPQTIDASRTVPTNASGSQTALISTSPLFGAPHRSHQPGARSPKRGDFTCMHPFEDSMTRCGREAGEKRGVAQSVPQGRKMCETGANGRPCLTPLPALPSLSRRRSLNPLARPSKRPGATSRRGQSVGPIRSGTGLAVQPLSAPKMRGLASAMSALWPKPGHDAQPQSVCQIRYLTR